MLKVIAYLFLLVSLIFWTGHDTNAAERVDQTTNGSNSPAQYIAKGGIAITQYNNIENSINQTFSEVRSKFSECLDITVAFQKERMEDLDNMIGAALMESGTVPEKDTKRWANDILEQSPRYQEEVEKNKKLVEKYNKELSKEMTSKIYKTFVYLIETIDSRLIALRDASPKTTYTKNQIFELFTDETSTTNSYTIRSFVYKNGNQIKVTIQPGKLKKGIVVTCPSIAFTELKGQTRGEHFEVYPRYPTPVIISSYAGPKLKKEIRLKSVGYDNRGSEILTDDFKEEFDNNFTEFIKLTFIP